MNSGKTILLLAPHTDDIEHGCGGTVVKHIKNGDNVIYVVFSICERSVPESFPKDILETECLQAAKCLGIKNRNIFINKLNVRDFSQNRQIILQYLIDLKKNNYKIDMVYSPSSADTHQDHHVIFEESCRAFKYTTHLGYDMPWNNINFQAKKYSILTEDEVLIKVRSLLKYKSQRFRTTSNVDNISTLLKFRGLEVGEKYAEAFEVIKWIN